ncbi:hypothetical protein BCR43DRAFT_59483 [Syncephalastrum racemosum]|uniref:Uncharacterized protein n=1 Tax=Syncephalastrum racemosum TaxID=13706 RepID=A0A1X2HVW8_SYNRA|nr:hypothetical protein BCR43DRAFT_59483 [Syncephalastrum racemosum]
MGIASCASTVKSPCSSPSTGKKYQSLLIPFCKEKVHPREGHSRFSKGKLRKLFYFYFLLYFYFLFFWIDTEGTDGFNSPHLVLGKEGEGVYLLIYHEDECLFDNGVFAAQDLSFCYGVLEMRGEGEGPFICP